MSKVSIVKVRTSFMSGNFEFQDTVNTYAMGRISVEPGTTGNRLCTANVDHFVMTKNTGEPFSLMNLKVTDQFGSGNNREVKITGYVRGSSTRKTASAWLNGITNVTLNWDNLIKVEIRSNTGNTCIDDRNVRS